MTLVRKPVPYTATRRALADMSPMTIVFRSRSFIARTIPWGIRAISSKEGMRNHEGVLYANAELRDLGKSMTPGIDGFISPRDAQWRPEGYGQMIDVADNAKTALPPINFAILDTMFGASNLYTPQTKAAQHLWPATEVNRVERMIRAVMQTTHSPKVKFTVIPRDRVELKDFPAHVRAAERKGACVFTIEEDNNGGSVGYPVSTAIKPTRSKVFAWNSQSRIAATVVSTGLTASARDNFGGMRFKGFRCATESGEQFDVVSFVGHDDWLPAVSEAKSGDLVLISCPRMIEGVPHRPSVVARLR